jgi:BRCT domain type II-containing protein
MTDTSTEYLTDEVSTDVEDVESTEATEKPAKEKKEPQRLSVDSLAEQGYTTPIGFKNELVKTERVPEDYRPQLVYAYVKNPGKKNPFPVKWTNGTEVFDTREDAQANTVEGKEARPVVHLEDALTWWDEKEQRRAEAKTAKETASTDEKPAAKKSRSRKAKAEEVVEVDEAPESYGDFNEAQ